MILVTGASGHFGNASIQYLLKKGVKANEIKALVRDVNSAEKLTELGVNITKGDYDDYPSLLKAFEGIDKLLFVSGSDVMKRLSQHQNVIKAAKEAGVKHIIYTSFQRKNEAESSPLWIVAQSHLQTEKWIKESGIDFSILKNNLYMDFLPGFIGEKVLETGVIYVPAGNGRISSVLREEMAEAAANIINSSNHQNKEYDFTNSESVSYQDIAQIISEVSGKSISYISPSVEEYTQTLLNYGLPAEAIGIFSSFAVGQASGELDNVSKDLENILGRKPESVRNYLSKLYMLKI